MNAPKCQFVVKEASKIKTHRLFERMAVDIVDGCRVLGSVIGNEKASEQFNIRKKWFKGRFAGFVVIRLIFWPSIKRLERTRNVGPKVKIQMNGVQKSEPDFRKDINWQ